MIEVLARSTLMPGGRKRKYVTPLTIPIPLYSIPFRDHSALEKTTKYTMKRVTISPSPSSVLHRLRNGRRQQPNAQRRIATARISHHARSITCSQIIHVAALRQARSQHQQHLFPLRNGLQFASTAGLSPQLLSSAAGGGDDDDDDDAHAGGSRCQSNVQTNRPLHKRNNINNINNNNGHNGYSKYTHFQRYHHHQQQQQQQRFGSDSIFGNLGRRAHQFQEQGQHQDRHGKQPVPRFLLQKTLYEKEIWLRDTLRNDPAPITAAILQHVLEALRDAVKDDPAAPRRAERWLLHCRDAGVKPTTACYKAIVEAWAWSNQEQAMVLVNRAERWLTECINQAAMARELNEDSDSDSANEQGEGHGKLHADGADPEMQPTLELYNAFLEACTKGRGGGRSRSNQNMVLKHATKAEAVLRRLIVLQKEDPNYANVIPTTETFNLVIRGWTRCKRYPAVAERVSNLVALMEDRHRADPLNSSVRPNTRTYAMAMDALIGVAKQKAHGSQQLNDGFNPDPTANGLDEIRQARAILDRLHKLEEAGDPDVASNTVAYNTLLSGWAALAAFHHNAPFEAEKVLRSMIALKDAGNDMAKPDSISYEKVMLAWSNAAHDNSGQRALWWLKKQWNSSELESDLALLPSNRTYNTVIKALLRTDGAQAAEDLLLHLGERFSREKDASLCPNSESFALVIQGWVGRAERHPDAAVRLDALKRASEWLKSVRKVEEERCVTTAPESYLILLRAARQSARAGHLQAYEIARETLDDLKETRYYLDPRAYMLMLRVTLESFERPPRSDNKGDDGDDDDDDSAAADEYEHDDNDIRCTTLMNLLDESCDEGLLNSGMLQALAGSRSNARFGWTEGEWTRIANQFFSEWPLPPSWTRNIKKVADMPSQEDLQQFPRRHRYSN